MRPDGWLLDDAPESSLFETNACVADRARSALLRVASVIEPEQAAAVVTHGAVLVALLRQAGQAHTEIANLAVGEFAIDPAGHIELVAVHDPLSPLVCCKELVELWPTARVSINA